MYEIKLALMLRIDKAPLICLCSLTIKKSMILINLYI